MGAVKKNVGDIHARTGCTGRPVHVPTRGRFEITLTGDVYALCSEITMEMAFRRCFEFS